MKKLTWCIYLLILPLMYVHGQWEISFLSGIGTTDIMEKNKPGVFDNTYAKGLGYSLGGFVNYPLYKGHIYFKTGIAFSEKGAYHPIYGSGRIWGKKRENVYYLESPLQLQLRFFSVFKFQGGIYNAYRLNMKPNEYGMYEASHVQYDSRHDVGYTAGAVIEYKKFVFEVNYSESIRSIGKVRKKDDNLQRYVLSDETTFYNKTLIFSFGYKIFVQQ